ncbi:MAG: hypothetical protein RL885_16260 [Planctomycetota bacterium]
MFGRKKKVVEWIGGALPLVEGDHEAVKHLVPHILVWATADGEPRGVTPVEPGKLEDSVCSSLEATLREAKRDSVPLPMRVRFEDQELADLLRKGFPAIEVVCEPTPKMEEVLYSLMQALSVAGQATYLSELVSSKEVAAFFDTAAKLYRAEPWKRFSADRSFLGIRLDDYGLEAAVLGVTGQDGRDPGFLLFEDLDDLEQYAELSSGEEAEPCDMPPHFSLIFRPAGELLPKLLEEIREHGWRVAGPRAYPVLAKGGEGAFEDPLEVDDFILGEILCQIILEVMKGIVAWEKVWEVGAGLSRKMRVKASGKFYEATVFTLGVEEERAFSSDDLLAEFRKLEREDLNRDITAPLQDALEARFLRSPEGTAFQDASMCHFVMDFAADYHGKTIASLAPSELREIVFEIIPRKVVVDAEEACEILEELEAFFVFLGRELGLEQAPACLEVLRATDAVSELEEALGDSSKFGMAKSVALGMGIPERFLLEPSSEPPGLPSKHRDTKPKKDKAKEKKKRKAAKQSRKKNR